MAQTNWKRYSLACLLALPFLTGAALAADLPTKKGPPPAPYAPAFTWTGFYAGVNGGYDWSDAKLNLDPFGSWLTDPFETGIPAFVAQQDSRGLNPAGFLAGAQIGYNWQTGPIVLGVEADADYTALHAGGLTGVMQTPPGTTPEPYAFQENARSNWLVTLRPRVGYAFDRILLYATGGLAIANYSYTSGYIHDPGPPGYGNEASMGSSSSTLVGWALGAGAEYALTDHWTVKGEYLYADLGKAPGFQTAENPSRFVGQVGGVPGPAFYSAAHSSSLTENVVRLGVNYKF
ncbi:outer membrane protein [Methylocapsa sp. S129]|uniref:outer membrane protein n=1 Tax=Methylocapsa sp. S129 TaxID=1641869 RepID=UPI00131CF561|nr:outer membrane protein [Methylocapsa sp. S129]